MKNVSQTTFRFALAQVLLALVLILNFSPNGFAQTPCAAPYNPTPASSWGMVQKFQSNAIIWNGGTPTAADLNGDGISEILAPANDYTGYYVYKGDGTNKTTASKDFVITTSSVRSVQPAIANIIGNSTSAPEVVMVNSTGFVYIFSNLGGTESNYLYKSTSASQYTNTATPYIVDIDQDGTAEIVLGSDVFGVVGNALVKRVAGPALGYIGQTLGSTGTPVDVIVADIISTNPGKELIYGSKVYAINLSNGTTTVLKDLSTVTGSGIASNDNGPTAIGDMNGDGKLDIVYNGSSFVVMWDPNGTTLANTLLFKRIPPSFNYGTRGLPLIANVFNDKTTGGKSTDLPEAVIINSVSGSAGIVTAYNLNYNTTAGTSTQHIWSIGTNDMSGCTGITAFDFDGNGIREIVYRDQSSLRIINGNLTTPVNYATEAVASSTWGEYPIVADLNNDGQAEIAVTGNNMLQVFGSDPATFAWKNAPNYWNQRNYRIVNINSNLTIPATEINAANSIAYNNNEAQLQLSDAVGNGVPSGYTYAPDATITINTVTAICPLITITATISNSGSNVLPAGTYVALYDANPTTGAANLIGTYQTTSAIAVGNSLNVTMTANISSVTSTIYAVVNDKGTTARPFNLSSWTPNTPTYECSYANNIDSETYTCLDSDGDSVVDLLDIDDDNDGVLDSIEQTSCSTPITLTPTSATSSPVYGGSTATRTIDGTGFSGTGLSALATAPATLENAWLLKEPETAGFIEYVMPGNSHVGGVALWAPDAFNYGGGDGPPKDFTVEVTYNGGRTFTSQIFTTARPNSSGALPGAQAFYFPVAFNDVSKLRLNFLSGWYDINNNSIGQVSTDGITVSAAYNMFLGEFRAICGNADIDTDNDGIPNRLDLDSDGDGCTDAVEAGVTGTLNSGTVKNGANGAVTSTNTLPNAIAAGSYGTNGLANGVETVADNGVISYVSTYAYANMRAYAACANADNDNINDLQDVDDDNDGVLDVNELSCTSPLNAITPTVTVGAVTTFADNNTGTFLKLGGSTVSKVSTTLYDTSIDVVQLAGTSSGSITLNNAYQLLKLTVADLDQSESVTLKVYDVLGNLIPLTSTNIAQQGNYVVTSYPAGSSMVVTAAGSATFNGSTSSAPNILLEIPFTAKRIEFYKTAGANNTWIGLLSGCNDQDTDNDGIPNRLDLDSDGDGCSDALESGATTATTANYVFSGTMGSNGLDNSLETSADNGVINYNLTYLYATSKNFALCADFDQDNSNDVVDVDDDNDGILDAIESPSCYYTRTEWLSGVRSGITVSTTLAMNATYGNPNKLVDGDNGTGGTSYAVNFNASTTAAQTVYAFKMPVPVELKTIYVGYVNANTHFNTNTILRLEGSNDNNSWTTLRSGYAAVSSVPGVTGTINANSFEVTQNSGKYLYYRIYWVSGGGVNATAYSNEVYFETYTNYQSSQYPKLDCISDTDGDGLFNHQDLDSDGDGCPDAREAGVSGTLNDGTIFNKVNGVLTSTPNVVGAIANGSYGVNGFADALETTAESGVYSGSYNYNYARSIGVVFCADTDNDWVVDLNDLDDDNDGVLDTEECPPFNINNLSYSPISYSVTNGASASQTFPAAPDGLVVNVWSLDNSFNIRINGTHLTNPEELQFFPNQSTDAVFEFLDGTTQGNIWEIAGNKLKPLIRVYIDQVGRIKVYGSKTGGGVLQEMRLRNGSFNNITLNTNSTNTFQIGQEVIGQTFITGDFGVVVPPSCDDDQDGIPNGQDLDSDGDGCPDAKESGVTGTLLSGSVKNGSNGAVTSTTTLPNAIAGSTGNYGANGLANVVETSTESGTIAYTSTYATYARSSSLSVCLDSDGDNVPDVIDIDDDNDGILDSIEQEGCFETGQSLAALTFSGLAVVAKSANSITASNTNAWNSSYSTQNFDLPISIKFKRPTIGNQAMFGFLPAYGTQNAANWNDDAYKFFFTSTNVHFPYGKTNNVTQTATEEDEYSVDISATGYITMKINGIQKVAFQGVNSAYKLAVSGLTTTVFTDIRLSNPSNPLVTTCTDTDGDGKPNYLDLDSDGDNCPDAKEAGVTGTLDVGTVVNKVNGIVSSTANVANAIATGGYGSNGFADAIETTAESGSFSGVYNYENAISSFLNACADFDGDGVADLIDIDDDNDGILDAVESPTCFFTQAELAQPIAVTTELAPYSTNVIGNSIDANATSYSAFAPSVSWVNKELFKLTALKPISITGIGFDLVNWAISNGASNTFKLQASNDNTTWTDLSTAVASTGTTGIFTLSNTLVPTTKYKYFRVLGVVGSTYYGGVYDIKFFLSSSTNSSQYTKTACSTGTTDGDAVPNHLDLDSDGDGCSDALEAGTTTIRTANFSFTGTDFGANGLKDTIERTAAESGYFNGTYTYDFANTNTINFCTDTDSDGTPDWTDLDNDNDGVLDSVEAPDCFYTNDETRIPVAVSTELAPYSTNVITNAIDNVATTLSAFDPSQNWVNKEIFKFTANNYIAITGMNFDLVSWAISNPATNTFKLQGSGDNALWTDLSTPTYSSGTTGTYTITNSLAPNTKFKYFRLIGVAGVSYYGGVKEARFNLASSVSPSANPKPTCTTDTDTDGILNQNDLDSDGDGCSDAIESGSSTTATSTSAYPTGSDTVLNGLLDVYESATPGVVNYTNYYTNYGINNVINACADTDTDGLRDVFDLDDDNDGILDVTEFNCSTSVMAKTGVNVSSSITWLYGNSATSLNALVDGVDGNTYVAYTDATFTNQTILQFDLPSSRILSQIELGNYPGQTPLIAGGTYKMQGWNGSAWFDIGGTQTVANTTPVYASNNSIKFSMADNYTAYTKYRIFGLSATGSQWAQEAYFTQRTCLTDIDNDGIPNVRDLDSDGDGCADAIEAGSSITATSTSSYPTGNDSNSNGFLDNYEGNTAGTINYTSTYALYALSNTKNACTDTDSDGLKDVIDLDDDNDGVLDSSESASCLTFGVDLNNLSFNGSAITSKTSNSINSAGGGAWKSSYSYENLKLPINLKFKQNSTTGAEMFGLLPVANAQTPANWNDGGYKFYPTSKNLYGYFTTTWDFGPIAIVPTDELSINISATGVVTAAVNGTTVRTFQGVVSDYKLVLSSLNAATISDVILTDFNNTLQTVCTDLDSDGDGIKNRLDLDSDGDGCSDAIEANSSTTATSTSAFPTGTDSNSNGLLNNYEGATTGTTNYLSTYTDYALSNAINACLDSDTDGIKDVIDIDDDNDGVLDVLEDKTCASLNISGSIAWEYWNVPKTHTWHDLLPMSGTGGSTAPNLFTIKDEYGMPDMQPYPTSTGAITSWTQPAGTDNSNIDVLRFQGYLHFPASVQGQRISVRVVPAGGAAKVGAWVISPDTNPKNWIDPTSSTGVPLLDMNNTLGFTNPGTGWTGVPVGFVDATSTFVGGSAIPAVRTASSNFTAKVISSANGHYVSFWIADPINAWDLFSFQYSIDNTNWIDLSVASFSTTAPSNCSVLDTDGDGTPNRLDLDSDGDGCFDSIESRTVTSISQSTLMGPFGNNGFANSIETGIESGVFSGTYEYSRALDANIKSCTDTDFDGVPDIDDLDDDNDGILDTAECPVNQLNTNESNGTFGTAATPRNTANTTVTGGYVYSGTNSAAAQYAIINQNTAFFPASTAFWRYPGHTTGSATDAYLAVNGSTTIGVFYNEAINLQASVKYRISFWHAAASAANDYSLTAELVNSGGSTIANASTGAQNSLGWKLATIDYTSPINQTVTFRIKNVSVNASGNDFSIDDISIAPLNCPDTDGDGIPNQLDLDSDGDGCADANEAYASSTASGTDGNGYFGNGNPPTVDGTGKVAGANYTSTSPNVLSVGRASVITTQPIDITTTPGAVNLIYSATVTAGSGTTTYQWQLSTNGGGTWANITNNATYSGATTRTLTLSAVTIAMKEYRYRLNIVQSDYVCGNLTSAVARLIMNNTPTVADDIASTTEDTPINGSVLTNDAGSGGSAISVTNFTVGGTQYAPGATATIANVGTIVVRANGTFTFTPVANYFGTVPTIAYTATDGNGGTDSGDLFITVTGVNDAPVVANETQTVNQGSNATGNVLTNDSDPDGNTLSITQFTIGGVSYNPGDVVTIPGKGTMVVNANGTYTFTPIASYSGPVPVVTYTVSDGNGSSVSGTLTISVADVNEAPLATDDIATTQQDSPISGNVLTNDSDPENNALSVTKYTISGVDYPAGTSHLIPSVGTIVVNANGTFTFTPASGYFGTVPDVIYTVSDGTLTDTGLIDINVNPIPNENPDAVADLKTTNEDTQATGSVLANDTDVDTPLANLVVTQFSFVVGGTTYTYPAGSTAQTIPGVGTLALNANGSYTFTPQTNYAGAVPVITYTISDGEGGIDTGTLTITITPVNDAPAAVNDAFSGPEDAAITGNVLTNDSDVEGSTLTISQFVVAGISGTFTAGSTATIPGKGTLRINANGTFTFTPEANYTGAVPVATYTVSDGTTSATADLALTITAVNDAPTAANDTDTTPEFTPKNGTVFGNDTDPDGDALTVTQFTVNGVSYVASTTAQTIPGVGTIILRADGTYTFSPIDNYVGSAPPITYTAKDPNGLTTTATLTITVTNVKDAPEAANDEITVLQGATASGGLLPNDTDVDGDALTISGFTIAGQTGPFVVGTPFVIAGTGTYTINANGTYTFVPDAAFRGTAPVVTYTLSDGNGGTDTATLTIYVAPVDQPPVATDDAGSANEDNPVTGNVLSNDTDVDAGSVLSVMQFTVGGVTYPAGTTATIPNVGTLVVNADGTYTFTPLANYNGTVPTISYVVTDTAGYTDTGDLVITIAAVNDAPLAVNDVKSGAEDAVISGNVKTNDSDPEGTALSISQFTIGSTNYSAGTTATITNVGTLVINSDGTYTFTPVANYNGTVPVVTYTLSDGSATSTATLSLSVTPVNDAPVASNDTDTTPQGSTKSGDILTGADTDADGNTLTLTQFAINGVTYPAGTTANLPGIGTLVVNADGTYTFTPIASYVGTVPTVTYTLSDGNGATATGTFIMTVTDVNEAPVATDDLKTISKNAVASGNLITNDSDPENNALTIANFTVNGITYAAGSTVRTIANVGTIVVNTNGTYTFTPLATYSGSVPAIDYIVSDGTLTDVGQLLITVEPGNANPVATDDPVTLNEDTPATGSVLTNDSDVNQADIITVVSFKIGTTSYPAGSTATIPNVGTLQLNANGTYTFTPFANYNGTVPLIEYTITDGAGGTDLGALNFTVTAVNDGPIAVNDDNISTPEDTPITGNVLSNDSDPDGNPITVTQFSIAGVTGPFTLGQAKTIPGKGSLLMNADGTFTFTPALNYNGPIPTITYTAADASGATDTAELNLAVTPVNDPPVLVADTKTVAESTTETDNVLTNDSDPEAGTLTVTQFTISGTTYTPGSIVIIPNKGTIVLNADGSYSFTGATGYSGSIPVISYTATDGTGGTSTSTLTITMQSTNDAPVVVNETVTTPEDTPVSGNLLTNDSDPESDPITIANFKVGGLTYNVGQTATIPGVGTMTVGLNGAYTFTPALNYNGIVPPIFYTVSDGTVTTEGSINLIVSAVNDAPVATDDVAVSEVNETKTGTVIPNDSDVENGTLSITNFTINGTVYPAGTTATMANVGTVVINADGTYSFTPVTNFAGALPAIDYTLSDGSGGTDTGRLSLTVTYDSDGDGIPDAIEKGTGVAPDTDGDGIPDYKDLDSDNDGILDAVENAVCGGSSGLCDTDNDGIPNVQDLDSDGDGIYDAVEAGGTSTNGTISGAVNAQGIPTAANGGFTPPNTDGTGASNPYDTDSDGDGIPDSVEGTTDTDGDGIPNYIDIDSDGDGISDETEGTTDSDGDGIPNYKDLDSDGDGIPDSIEGVVDTDGDGVPNYKDLDSDADGIPDAIEGVVDTDGDGIPNYKETDSDNDGIPDATEGTVDTDGDGIPNYKDVDSDGDGIPDATEGTVDTDGDGTPNYKDLDSDGDGIPDSVEGTVDTDGDGVPNYKDLDSDGDGIPDAAEKGIDPTNPVDTDLDGTPDYKDTDSDGDGILDAIEGTIDTDGDGIPNFRDLDSDNDGIPDSVEGTVDTDGDGIPNYIDPDSDGDGKPDSTEGTVDTDTDGTPDYKDLDSDGDGVPDATDQCPLVVGTSPTGCPADFDADTYDDVNDLDDDNDGILDSVENAACNPVSNACDTDGDGIPNRLDRDSDNDGIFDVIEAGGTDANANGEADGAVDANGIPSSAGPGITPPDTDGNGGSNPYDTDSDGDGISDRIEGLTDSDGDGTPNYLDLDSDGDGLPDSVEGTRDTDGDGTADYLDLDSDGDGIKDVIEANGTDANNDGKVDSPTVLTAIDTDNDSIPDYRDVDSDNDGILDRIEGVVDTDADGRPNYRDPDSDSDGISDLIEGTRDTDSDGTPDYLDLDSDGDGITDIVEGSTDTDGDGIPNFRDLDSDGDGITDATEGTTASDNDGIPNYLDTDSDGDGISDAIEGTLDTDNDGTPDYKDLDSDGDGINDSIEGNVDTDGDGIPNFRDLDSDADGIPDATELRGDPDGDNIPNYLDPDSDGDGISDLIEGLTDTDGDNIPDYLDLDSDGDGITDANEKGSGNTPVDTDSDGIPDFRDTDSDNDTVLDGSDQCRLTVGTVLLNGCPVDYDSDGVVDTADLDDDNDGILDSIENAACSPASPNCDTDGDGIPNRFDLDSDGDGIKDVREANGLDFNGDGIVDGAVDANGVPVDANGGYTAPNTDGTGGLDPYDTDSDGDGITDAIEKGSNGNAPRDTDGDNIPDYRETDADNDGIPDSIEGLIDTDGDGIPNYRDTDSDGDGIPDSIEGTRDTDGDGTPDYKDLDSDNDGLRDATEGAVDTDGDGLPDYRDVDSDGDGILDANEHGSGSTTTDADGDGIPDFRDLDTDGDGVSDAMETADGTSPTNPCAFVITHQTLTPNAAWLTADCDGDGNPNATDPNKLTPSATNDLLQSGPTGIISGNILTNDDFLPGASISISRMAGGTATGTATFNALTGLMIYVPAANEGGRVTLTYQVCNTLTSVCATATVTIEVCDPSNPASDCDGDGVSNGQEAIDGTDPANACSLNSANQRLVPSAAWLANDCDGDGVTNAVERTDGTDPTSGCSYNPASQVIANATSVWTSYDCDGDGNPNGTDPSPLDFCVGGLAGAVPAIGTPQYKFFQNADCDYDGISNSFECFGGGPTCQDFDGDGIPNYLDEDSDGDGINDSYEKNRDSDGDGDADYVDLDSDNDGIPDKREYIGDVDGDGIPNYLDKDSDGDGILDSAEGNAKFRAATDANADGVVDCATIDTNGNGLGDCVEGAGALEVPDTDKDGTPDFLDLDADGDGIPDSVELTNDPDGDRIPNYRDLDSDGDWLADGIEGLADTDKDGTPNYLDLDSDADGIPDSWEGADRCPSCTGLQDDQGDGYDDRKQFVNPLPADTDADGTPDYLDLDSDNDGIPDRVELGADTDGDGIPNFRDIDSDNDGIPDRVEAGKDPNSPVDTDGDGKPDYLDLDSDNDGIPDTLEAGKDPLNPVDTDGDGKPDYQDTDSDNDGIPDRVEAGKDPLNPVDTDGDGKPDYLDTDSDNDGIPDSVEAGKDPSKPVDTDGDGKPDYQDTDSDNDGLPDFVEAGKDPSKPMDTDGDGKPDYLDTDSDNDGIPDTLEAGSNPLKPVDTDGDGKPDYLDTDSDNDGIPDAVEAGKDPLNPVDTDKDGKPDYLDTDSDNDGIPDAVEAGKDPAIPVDTDGDGKPDYLDTDSDNDGISDTVEAGKDPSKPVDTDGDGKPDYQDTDSDNDSIPDAVEAGPNPNKPIDTDGDGKPDYLDTDSDNDGIPDRVEAGKDPSKPVDTDGDGLPDYRDLDSDNDGYSDTYEAGPDKNNPVDTDKDGKPDYQDIDSDGDVIEDKLEDDVNYGALPDCDKDGIENRLDTDDCADFAPQGISPNGDGLNDVLIIPGILRHQPNTLTIFNRWGNIVYQTENYKNDWGGKTDRGFNLVEDDQLLPDGTYYYVIDYHGKWPDVGQYVYINRLAK